MGSELKLVFLFQAGAIFLSVSLFLLFSSLLLIVTSLHKFWNYVTSRNSSQRNRNKLTAVWNYILPKCFYRACVHVTLVPVMVTGITVWTDGWTERRKNKWRKEWSDKNVPDVEREITTNALNDLFNVCRSDIFYSQPTRCNNKGLLIIPISLTYLGRWFCPSSGALDCVYSLWYNAPTTVCCR
jgi:hypothetical protein